MTNRNLRQSAVTPDLGRDPVAAYIRRLGPGPEPRQLALAITRAGILAPRPRQITRYPSV